LSTNGIPTGAVRRCTLILLTVVAVAGAPAVSGQEPVARPVVLMIPIEGPIDLRLAPLVRRTLEEASRIEAKAVVLEIDTFGARVDAAVLICDVLLRSRVRTVAFVRGR
jgi:membrane-bound serine protease (ClpP class)